MPVTTDGPGNVYVPQSAADFVSLGLATPDYLWLCQDSAAPLAPTIGGLNLSQNNGAGSGGYVFQQSLSGWTRKFVGFPNQNNNSFYVFNSAFDFAAGESYAVLIYAAVARPASGYGWLIYLPRGVLALHAAGTLLHRNSNFTDTTFALAHGDVGTPTTVRPWIWYRNAATNVSGAMTDIEHRIGVHDESVGPVGSSMNPFGGLGTVSPAMRCCFGAIFKGTNAERDWRAYLQGLNWNVWTDGVAAVTLGGLASTAAAMADVQGQLSATLATLAGTSTATVDVAGQTSATLESVAPSAAGTVDIAGVTASTLDALVAQGAAGIDVAGALATTLGEVTSAATAMVDVVGALSGALDPTAGSVTGTVEVMGQASQALAELAAVGAGIAEIAGLASATLDDAIAQGAAGVTVVGALDGALGALTAACDAAVLVVGSCAITLDDSEGEATAIVEVRGASGFTLDPATGGGQGVLAVLAGLDVALGELISQGAGGLDVVGQLAAELAVLSGAAAGEVALFGDLALALDDAEAAAEGTAFFIPIAGALTRALEGAELVGDGAVDVAGALAIVLADAVNAVNSIPLGVLILAGEGMVGWLYPALTGGIARTGATWSATVARVADARATLERVR